MTTHDEEIPRLLEVGGPELPAPGPLGHLIEPIDIAGPEGGESSSTGGMAKQILQVFVQNRLAVVGVVVIVFFLLFCFVGPYLYHTNQTNSELALQNAYQNASPGKGTPLGTDATGFDILGRLMFGGQTSLIVGFASAFVATVFGVIYGALSGFIGGWVDAILMRIVDILLSIPSVFFLIVLVTVFRATEILFIFVIAFVSWLAPARLIRGETLSLREREYVQSVRVMGGSRTRIVGRHIVPNTIGTIVVFATFQIADSILLLAALGFVGLGVPPPGTDWGSMLSDGVNTALSGYWWEIYPAGLCIVLVVISFSFIGDALADALEVRSQRR